MSNLAKQFFTLQIGSLVSGSDKTYRVTHLISTDTVLAVELATGQSQRLSVEGLKLVDPAQPKETKPDRDLLDYSEKEWEEGQRRLQAIKPLLENPLRSRAEAERIAATQGVHVGTLYRWLAAYTDAGHVTALVPEKRGRKNGTRRLDEAQELVVESVIEKFFLHKQRRTPVEAVEEIQRRCRLAKITPPHPNTIRNRIARIPDGVRLSKRGRKEEAVNKYSPVRGSFPGADHPFTVVQIDHTPADIICVDEVHRKPIARPYLTLAIDVYSRMVAGFYLSYDPPSAASVGLCLAQAMCPKREYLAGLGVSGSWPVWGRIGTVHCDNAKEFRGVVLERGCNEHGIDLAWRPVKVPRYGGHIERMMRTVAAEFHKLPGTTFSNSRDRKGYDSLAEATMTLKELERHLAEFFVNNYHQRVHSELGMSPLRCWEMGLTGTESSPGLGLMPLPHDPERLLLDFMPYVERTIQPYGIQIDKINYYDPVLDPYINAIDTTSGTKGGRSKQNFIIRRHPGDISRVYFFDPVAHRYCAIPYRNLAHPPMSLYELREVRRKLEEEGRRDVDEELIFDSLNRMRARVEESTQKSKSARRNAARAARPSVGVPQPAGRVASRGGVPAPASNAALPFAAASVTTFDDDPFAMPVRPFDELALKR